MELAVWNGALNMHDPRCIVCVASLVYKHNKVFQSASHKCSTHLQTVLASSRLYCVPGVSLLNCMAVLIIWKFVHPECQKSPEWHLRALIGWLFVRHCANWFDQTQSLCQHARKQLGFFFVNKCWLCHFFLLFCCRLLQCSKTMRRFSRVPPQLRAMMIRRSRKSRK